MKESLTSLHRRITADDKETPARRLKDTLTRALKATGRYRTPNKLIVVDDRPKKSHSHDIKDIVTAAVKEAVAIISPQTFEDQAKATIAYLKKVEGLKPHERAAVMLRATSKMSYDAIAKDLWDRQLVSRPITGEGIRRMLLKLSTTMPGIAAALAKPSKKAQSRLDDEERQAKQVEDIYNEAD
jgi:hypothetical protein